ncbi:MAG: PIN/TRAM domain-containing protein [Thermodesulfobacteriota bacterium]
MKLIISFSIIVGLVIYFLALSLNNFTYQGSLIATGAGVLGTFSVLSIFYLLFRETSQKSALGIAIGILTGILLYFCLIQILETVYITSIYEPYIKTISFLLLIFLGTTLGFVKTSDQYSTKKYLIKNRGGTTKIVDTSVIIDGRIADVAEAGFIEGDLIIPKFIIKELQHIADSPDPTKKVRGRRGLDVLKRMQKEIPGLVVKITGHDFKDIKEADLKLVELARKIKAEIITNDFNLNKVAGLQGVKVLNLNQLANAIKPVVLPGENLAITLVKEGKEQRQAVGYLDDGTMVVVDDAIKFLGRDINVSITSVLQTSTGRMIFAKIEREDMISSLNG